MLSRYDILRMRNDISQIWYHAREFSQQHLRHWFRNNTWKILLCHPARHRKWESQMTSTFTRVWEGKSLWNLCVFENSKVCIIVFNELSKKWKVFKLGMFGLKLTTARYAYGCTHKHGKKSTKVEHQFCRLVPRKQPVQAFVLNWQTKNQCFVSFLWV